MEPAVLDEIQRIFCESDGEERLVSKMTATITYVDA